jgi:hypothetical protein
MLAVLLISITKVYKLSKAFVDRDEVKADEWIKAESEMRSQTDNKLPAVSGVAESPTFEERKVSGMTDICSRAHSVRIDSLLTRNPHHRGVWL